MQTNVEAHITGTIFAVETEVGAEVAVGDVLVVLESMKMEMPVEAPVAGRVAEVRGSEGDNVDEGAVLCVLE